MSFLTPIWEIRNIPAERFVCLSYDKNMKPTVYRYSNVTTKEVKKVDLPTKAFKRIVLATLEDSKEIVYMDSDGSIKKELAP